MSRKFKNGFTLVEVTVAVSVLLVGILGIYSLVPKIISVSAINLNRFVASQLAREGLEIIRNIRDSNWLQGINWQTGLEGCSFGCEIDYNDSHPQPYQDRYLKIDANGFYNYEVGENTKFKRKITITFPNPDVMEVEVEVSWKGKYSPLKVSEVLYNWR